MYNYRNTRAHTNITFLYSTERDRERKRERERAVRQVECQSLAEAMEAASAGAEVALWLGLLR